MTSQFGRYLAEITVRKEDLKASSPIRIDSAARLRQIESIVTQYGRAITDLEVAKHLGLKVKYLWQWARKNNVDLAQFNFVKAKIFAGDFEKEKPASIFISEEVRIKYLIFKIMLIFVGLFNLTGWHKDLQKKAQSEGLDEREKVRWQDVESGIAFLPGRISQLNIPEPGYSLEITKGVNYRDQLREHLAKAIRMLEDKNKLAAEAALVGALLSLDKELELLMPERRFQEPKVRVWRPKPGVYKFIEGTYKNYPVTTEEAVSVKIHKPKTTRLRWLLAQLVDHSIDSEFNENGYIESYLDILQGISEKIAAARSGKQPLNMESRQQLKEEIEDIANQLNPRWDLDKVFAQCSLRITAGLLREMELDLYYVDAVLGIAQRFFTERKKDCLGIIEGLEAGLQKAMREGTARHNDELSSKIEELYTGRSRKLAWGLSRRYDIRNEPEFRDTSPLFGWIADDIKEGKDIEEPTKRLRRKMTDVRLGGEGTIRFRNDYRDARLSGKPEGCRYEVFEQSYQEFAQSNNIVRGSPHLRIKIYLPAMNIPLRIKEKINSKKEKDNPAFNLLSICANIQSTRTLSFRIPGLTLRDHHDTITLLQKFVNEGKKYLYMLDEHEREKILNSLISEFYPTIFDLLLLAEHKQDIEQALKLFLNPDLTDYAEISDSVL